jgi:hypothetical protein
MQPNFETPWPKPNRDECAFYHSMQFPDGESVPGPWTIPDFVNYIGGYDLRGKTVLDVGTASGYLAFSAENAGAAEVTGFDAATAHEFRNVPFAQSPPYRDVVAWREGWTKENLIPVKRSWWYGWHKTKSNAHCVYAPIPELYEWDRTFDVVIAGAIVEHLSDPVYAIGAWSKVAREAVVLPFTDVVADDTLLMRPDYPWTNPEGFTLGWWQLSAGLYRRLFDNLGFDFAFETTNAVYNVGPEGPRAVQRPTIIARRR